MYYLLFRGAPRQETGKDLTMLTSLYEKFVQWKESPEGSWLEVFLKVE